jgi:hypothetical protein
VSIRAFRGSRSLRELQLRANPFPHRVEVIHIDQSVAIDIGPSNQSQVFLPSQFVWWPVYGIEQITRGRIDPVRRDFTDPTDVGAALGGGGEARHGRKGVGAGALGDGAVRPASRLVPSAPVMELKPRAGSRRISFSAEKVGALIQILAPELEGPRDDKHDSSSQDIPREFQVLNNGADAGWVPVSGTKRTLGNLLQNPTFLHLPQFQELALELWEVEESRILK